MPACKQHSRYCNIIYSQGKNRATNVLPAHFAAVKSMYKPYSDALFGFRVVLCYIFPIDDLPDVLEIFWSGIFVLRIIGYTCVN